MNLTSSLVALSVLLTCASGVLAADNTTKPAKTTPAVKAQTKPAQHQPTVLTGSYIKQNTRRNGVVTDGPNPVVVLDNEAIRNSGAADLRELLVLRGLSH